MSSIRVHVSIGTCRDGARSSKLLSLNSDHSLQNLRMRYLHGFIACVRCIALMIAVEHVLPRRGRAVLLVRECFQSLGAKADQQVI